MPNLPMAYFWKGKRIDELSREELIEALRYSIQELHAAFDRATATAQMHRMFAEVRKQAA